MSRRSNRVRLSWLLHLALAPVEAVQLVSFANPDPSLPDLLNVTVEPAGDAPLWTDAGGLSLAIYFRAIEAGPALPGAQAGVRSPAGAFP